MANMLYNGVELPIVPVVDGYSYYAIREDNDNNKYDVIYASSNFYKGQTGIQAVNMTTTVMYSLQMDGATEWAYYATYPNTSYTVTDTRKIIFTNADIYTDYINMNEVWMAASEPVDPNAPTFDTTTFLSGLTMGLTGKGVPELSGKCLYNGVELPSIESVYTPELQESYPYAVMLQDYVSGTGAPDYLLYCLDSPCREGLTNYYIPTSVNRFVFLATDTGWEYWKSGTGTSLVTFGNALWANHDISPILVSDPVPVEPDVFTRGYLLGAELRNTRPAREPVAYLYNGVRLPGIDAVYTQEVQKTHPYAYMYLDKDTSAYTLVVNIWPIYYHPDSVFGKYVQLSRYIRYRLNGSVWEFVEENGGVFVFIEDIDGFEWTNADIYNYDGDVFYLAASEPVPVYE